MKKSISWYSLWKRIGKQPIHKNQYGHFGRNRTPSGTVIRESLKMVGRMANIAANNVCLSPYNSCIFKE